MYSSFLRSVFAACVLVLSFTACDGGGANSGRTCSLATSTSTPSIAMTVSYQATGQGDVTIERITYQTNGGTETVENPNLPWSTTIDASAGTAISIEATAEVDGGTATIQYNGSGQEGGTTEQIQATDQCGGS